MLSAEVPDVLCYRRPKIQPEIAAFSAGKFCQQPGPSDNTAGA